MAEWTKDAYEYLDGYLKQVSALAKRLGDDAEDIVSGLRDHITQEVELNCSGTVEIDELLVVLARIGAPEEVVSLDTPLRGTSRPAPTAGATVPPPNIPPAPQVPQQVIVKHRSWLSCALTALGVVVLGYVLFLVLLSIAGMVTAVLSRSSEAGRRAVCSNNLKQIGIALKNYADDHNSTLPPISYEAGCLMFDANEIYPNYLKDSSNLICPSDDDEVITTDTNDSAKGFINDHSYYYLSRALMSEEEGLAYVKAYGVAAKQKSAQEGNKGSLDNYIEVALLNKVQLSENAHRIPLLVEKPDHHKPGGGNVLFLDGHVEFIEMDEGFPMTTEFMEALKSIDD